MNERNGNRILRFRSIQFAAALALAFASTSMADIVGSTYNFTASSTGGTQIAATNGTYTSPSNPGFCVGPPTACGSGSGVSGSFAFNDIDATHSTITFTFYGSTYSTTGSFSVDLGNFSTPDGDVITGVTYGSGNLSSGNFTNVVWTGTDAIFTGTPGSDYNAIGGRSVVFDVAMQAVPEPSSYLLSGFGLAGLAFIGMMRKRAASRI